MTGTEGEDGGERGHEQETRTGPIKVLGLAVREKRQIYLNSLVCVEINVSDTQNWDDRVRN